MGPLFDRSLRKIVKPALARHGFQFDGRRRFKGVINGKSVGIEFQLGQRSMQGRFTVNLIVGDRRHRLGLVRETTWSRFIDRIFGDFDPWWKGILLPKDRWWRINDSESRMEKTLREVVDCIERHGLPWLKQQTAA